MTEDAAANAYAWRLASWMAPVGEDRTEPSEDEWLEAIQRATPLRPGSGMYAVTDDFIDCLTSPFAHPVEVLASQGRLAGWATAAAPFTWTWAAGVLWSTVDSLPESDPWRQLSVRLRSPYVQLTPDGCETRIDYAHSFAGTPVPERTGASFDGTPFGSVLTGTVRDFRITVGDPGTPSAPVLRRPLPQLSAALIGIAGHVTARDLASVLASCVATLDEVRPALSTLPTGSDVITYAFWHALRWAAWRRHEHASFIDELALVSTQWTAYATDLINPDVTTPRIPDPNLPERLHGPYDIDLTWWRSSSA